MPEARKTSRALNDFDPERPAPAGTAACDLSQPELPAAGSARLNSGTKKAGALAGAAVNTAKSLSRRRQKVPRRMKSIKQELAERGAELREDVREWSAEAREKARELTRGAGEKLDHLKEEAGETLSQWKEDARLKTEEARLRARRFAHENPFQLIAIVAAAAFTLGVGLRIWRSTRG